MKRQRSSEDDAEHCLQRFLGHVSFQFLSFRRNASISYSKMSDLCICLRPEFPLSMATKRVSRQFSLDFPFCSQSVTTSCQPEPAANFAEASDLRSLIGAEFSPRGFSRRASVCNRENVFTMLQLCDASQPAIFCCGCCQSQETSDIADSWAIHHSSSLTRV